MADNLKKKPIYGTEFYQLPFAKTNKIQTNKIKFRTTNDHFKLEVTFL